MSARATATALLCSLLSCGSASVAETALPPPTIISGSFSAERQPDGNTIVYEEPDGLIVVDTGRHLEHQQKIVDFAKARGKPITVIVNTHWHLDHSGGNAEIRAVYPAALLYASNAVAGALDGFLARALERGRARLADPNLSEAEKAETRLGVDAIEGRHNLLPDVPVTGTTRIPGDSRGLELRLARNAATEGDVWVYDPVARTVVAGDLVVVPAPFFDTACPEGWQRALAELAAAPFERLIPGHGDAMTRAEFDRYRSAFDALVDCAGSDAAKQICIDGWLRDAAHFLTNEDDRKNANMLLDYYIGQILSNDEKRSEFCKM